MTSGRESAIGTDYPGERHIPAREQTVQFAMESVPPRSWLNLARFPVSRVSDRFTSPSF